VRDLAERNKVMASVHSVCSRGEKDGIKLNSRTIINAQERVVAMMEPADYYHPGTLDLEIVGVGPFS